MERVILLNRIYEKFTTYNSTSFNKTLYYALARAEFTLLNQKDF